MTNLKELTVSLTKHGAHKVAVLLKKYDTHEVLKHVYDRELNVDINSAQARKTLGADGAGNVPPIWAEAKRRGSETIDALVFIAIVFSHHKLISTMADSVDKRQFAGRINRGDVIADKAYTNFAHIIEELGYSTEHSPDHVNYYVRKIFEIKDLHQLVTTLLTMRLKSAGWDQKNALADECIALGFQNVFSVTGEQFRSWLSSGSLATTHDVQPGVEDPEFFVDANDGFPSIPFKFQPGHHNKKTGTVKVRKTSDESTATLLHNQIQNDLYAMLVKEHGAECVGTEVPTGDGTSIDIVVQTDKDSRFYEIKTADSVKACIRQAIPQLLEYAYWHGKNDRSDSLIIVSPLQITNEAKKYLSFLASEFGIPISYQQHVVKKV